MHFLWLQSDASHTLTTSCALTHSKFKSTSTCERYSRAIVDAVLLLDRHQRPPGRLYRVRFQHLFLVLGHGLPAHGQLTHVMNHVRGPVHLLSHLHLPQPAFLRFYCYAIEHFFHVQFSPQRTFGGVVLHVCCTTTTFLSFLYLRQ
ncbi:unnamed protein product [Aphis gossypii]|uniref:Uncharacterized protein n=1 Tax=Aphis gossypii TaxID=80765 RepID=A0A9P0NN78_APHGO|nr:unnamed protein product [Aphis gossypii]